ncbi:MAG TPA: protease complex subunit PrcB family protein [Thermoanaerobaculia bacterium]|nr:protease complex subunit PrcB family protein [Thermoanaerobaculia bacterium]
MKTAAFLLLATTCATMSAGPVDIRTITTGAYAFGKPTATAAHAAQDDVTYRRLWTSLVGGGSEAPAIDFASESVVFLIAGQKNTGGWSVVPRGAKVEDDTLVIDAEIKGPGPDDIVTMAFTSPYAVIAVKAKGYKNVRWDR